jgi:hypothetical protein
MNNSVLTKPNERAQVVTLSTSKSIKNYILLGVLAWFFLSLIGGWFGIFSQPDQLPVLLGLFIALPLIIFATLYLASSQFRAFAHSIQLPLIVGAHLWRFVGFSFILAYLLGYLPAGFGIPEGVGDIIAAIFALPLAIALHRRKPVRRTFVIWNIYGLADLVSALTMGLLYSQGPLGILRTDVSTALMTTFPVNLIPTFFVPLFIMFHILALIRRKEVGATGPMVSPSLPSALKPSSYPKL